MEVSVANFGPLTSARIRLQPLTVFVGPNNSGKSYLAMLLYSLYQAYSGEAAFGLRSLRDGPGGFSVSMAKRVLQWAHSEDQEFVDSHGDALLTWLDQVSGDDPGVNRLRIGDLPAFLQMPMRELVRSACLDFADSTHAAVQRSFGAKMAALIGWANPSSQVSVRLHHDAPAWSLDMQLGDGEVRAQMAEEAIADLIIPFTLPVALPPRRGRPNPQAKAWKELRWSAEQALLIECFREFQRSVLYLPADRGGYLQASRAIASGMVQQSLIFRSPPGDGSLLPGVVSDFISMMISLPYAHVGELANVAASIERDILSGDLAVTPSDHAFPDIAYRSRGVSIPMHRSSSMVSELAPVLLLLRHGIAPGDMLIIEEPEAHLHPANQRKFALGIARMVRAGLRVLLSTHSDYFLAELSNGVRRSELDEAGGAFLRPQEVGAYLFNLDATTGTSYVQELPISAVDGIPEDGFVQAADELYEETAYLQTANALSR